MEQSKPEVTMEQMTLTRDELQAIIRAAILEARKEAEAKARPEPLTPEAVKQRTHQAVMSAADAVADCAKIGLQGLFNAADDVFTAGVRIGLRLLGRA